MRLVDNVDLESGILGGIVIGLTTSSFLVLTGRLTGISGFVEDTVIFRLGQDQKWWTWAYCSGLIASGALFNHLNPGFFSTAGIVFMTFIFKPFHLTDLLQLRLNSSLCF